MELAVITIDIDPEIQLGPLTLAWHGLMIAVGIAVGSVFAVRHGRELGLDPERLLNAALVLVLVGIAGSRLLFLVENDPGALLEPGEWFGTRGFSIYGAVVFGALAAAVYLRRSGMGVRSMDALAAGFPIGLVVGRIGDVINGEHFGPESDAPWAFRYLHPDAEVPSAAVAFHSGGFYEVLLGLAMFALVWPLRHRVRRAGMLLWAVIGLYAAGRFVMFFYREDSDELWLGLVGSQWISLALLGLAAAGAAWSLRNAREARAPARRTALARVR